MALAPRKLLICSLGNPVPYRNTRHSAGHILAELITTSLSYPSFSVDRAYGGLVSQPLYDTPYTFFQSPSLMNISGKPVRNAWMRFQAELTPAERERALLVVMHDELEKEMGKVKVKMQGSHGGHNGVRSCIELIKGEFVRIGVGIGRPESRGVKAVTTHVLGRVLAWERECFELRTMPKVLQALEKLVKMP